MTEDYLRNAAPRRNSGCDASPNRLVHWLEEILPLPTAPFHEDAVAERVDAFAFELRRHVVHVDADIGQLLLVEDNEINQQVAVEILGEDDGRRAGSTAEVGDRQIGGAAQTVGAGGLPEPEVPSPTILVALATIRAGLRRRPMADSAAATCASLDGEVPPTVTLRPETSTSAQSWPS